jgi:4a-hydroxytetrahydrobiopterin dehydratase
MNELSSEHCSPITSISHLLNEDQAGLLLARLSDWKIISKDNESRLEKSFKFADFKQALDFTGRIGRLAEEEDHHPVLVTEWGKVTVEWWTHKIKGLHRNDFIMAAKNDELYSVSH